MAESSDVVIIGGGAAGCATAYYLSRAGAGVTIVEREGVASQASGFAAGGLNPLEGVGLPGPLSPLAAASFRLHQELWGQLEEEACIDFHARVIGLIKLAFDEGELPGLRSTVDTFSQAEGFEGRWLDSRQVSELEPRLTGKAIQGVYAYGNAVVDSLEYTQALSQGAGKHGAKVRPGTVKGVRSSGGRAEAVLLEDGEIPCGQVVLALGPWSRKAEAWLDIYIPVDPLKGEILRIDLPGPPLEYDISGGGGSLYAKSDGLVWCGATEDWRGFDLEPTESARRSILDRASRLIPALAESPVVKHTACLRPVTPDWLPIVGQAPGWDNVYLATGAGKKGILVSPGIGKATADLITQGRTSLPLDNYRPDRFKM